ncbi:MAG: glutamate cyclase domain-containing protein, partial [Janthinobacterium lividum]
LLTASVELAHARTVMICTGASVADTKPVLDGVIGAAALANGLIRAGKMVTLVTDRRNLPMLKEALKILNEHGQYLKTHIMSEHDDGILFANNLLSLCKPDAVVSVGVFGRNAQGQKPGTANFDCIGLNPPLDEIINRANSRNIGTIGIASHPCHCGMGGVSLTGKPDSQAVVPARHLVWAPTVNLGAQALEHIMLALKGKNDRASTPDQYGLQVDTLMKMGAVDGDEQRSAQEQSVNARLCSGTPPAINNGNSITKLLRKYREQQMAMEALGQRAQQIPHFPSMVISREPNKLTRFRIATFDSSDGGLIAAKNLLGWIKARSTHTVSCDNVGDHANSPYGKLHRDDIITATKAGLHFIESELKPTLTVMACNTACTGAPEIYQHIQTPYVDLVQTTTNAIIEHGGEHPILLGTLGMINSNLYPRLVANSPPRFNRPQSILQVAGGDHHDLELSIDLASLLNRGAHLDSGAEEDKQALEALIKKIINQMMPQLGSATSVWLVCTHYPLIQERLQTALNEKLRLMGIQKPVNIIDAMEFQAMEVIAKLDELSADEDNGERMEKAIRVFTHGTTEPVIRSVQSIYKKHAQITVEQWQGVKVRKMN